VAAPVGPIVVAPAAFKGALSGADAARALATGLRLAAPDVEIRPVPVADGGEGTLDALVAAREGRVRTFGVADPLGRPTSAKVGLLPDGTAVIESAQASGYELLNAAERDPEVTSTFGTGELIRAALDARPKRILITLGGSATNDAGLGMIRALGGRVLDAAGTELEGRGVDLGRVAWIDVAGLDPRLGDVAIDVACDVRNPFHGPDGAAVVFGPQKGADPAAVERLDRGLVSLANVLRRQTGVEVQTIPGAGAAGGAAGGMVALLGARLVPGAELVLEALGLADALDDASLCITGEGRLDEQTLEGKAPAAVAAMCRDRGVPCVGVCGELRLLPGLVRRMGMAGAFAIGREVLALQDALAATENDLAAMGAAIGGLLVGFSSAGDRES
jgi:glycerate 2-kinase